MAKNYFDLTGQVAIVTGCSTGLGVQMAKALANQGANIVCVARRQEMIDANAKEIAEEFGVKTLAVRCDITNTEMVAEAVQKVLDAFGRIDILVNNAGTGAVAPAEDITDPQFEQEVNIDLFGTFKFAREVATDAPLLPQYLTQYIELFTREYAEIEEYDTYLSVFRLFQGYANGSTTAEVDRLIEKWKESIMNGSDEYKYLTVPWGGGEKLIEVDEKGNTHLADKPKPANSDEQNSAYYADPLFTD